MLRNPAWYYLFPECTFWVFLWLKWESSYVECYDYEPDKQFSFFPLGIKNYSALKRHQGILLYRYTSIQDVLLLSNWSSGEFLNSFWISEFWILNSFWIFRIQFEFLTSSSDLWWASEKGETLTIPRALFLMVYLCRLVHPFTERTFIWDGWVLIFSPTSQVLLVNC